MAYSERRWLSANGLELCARDYPTAEDRGRAPIVCIHGLTRNSRDFEDVAPILAAQSRRVIVPDMRGRGRSARDPDPANYTYSTYAADVIALLDSLGIESAVFLGTSMGGAIAMTVAALAGPRVAAAILNDVGGEVSADGIARIVKYIGKGADIRDWTMAAAYARETNGYALPNLDDHGWNRIARRIFVENETGAPVLDYDPAISVPVDPLAPIAAVELWPALDILTADRPVLVLRGELSDILSKDVAEQMCIRAADLTLVTVPGVGHAPLLDEPEALAAITAFLERTV